MQEYRRHTGWNQSSLKKIIGFNDNSEEEKVLPGVRKHINLGSTVDLILSYDNYRDYLFIYEEKEPSETITKIINNAQEIDPEISDDSIRQSIELCNYIGNRSWDMQRKLEEIRKNAEEYIQFRLDSINKLITSQLQLDRAEQIVSNLYTASNTKDFFNQKCIKQEEIYFTHKGLECKALLDRTIFEENNIIQPIDYKVTDSALQNWKYVGRKFRYDIQAAFYTLALSYKYPNVTIKPFKFIVASSNPNILPYVYTVTPHDLFIGQFGFTVEKVIKTTAPLVYNDVVYGFDHAINLINAAQELNINHYDIEGHYNNRTVDLNLWNS